MTRSSTETVTFGISANEHDAALAVIQGSEILFAAHAERYSRIKNDPHLNDDLIKDALSYGEPQRIIWYERPLLKRARKLFAGQYDEVFRIDGAAYLRKKFGITVPVAYVGHHHAHAAASFFTSPFENAAVAVIDAIGEWTTISVWEGRSRTLRCLWRQLYPHSLGLLYSAFTQRCGLKPNEEEYILMGMASYGEPRFADLIRSDFIADSAAPNFRLNRNVHRGIRSWRPEIDAVRDLAASIQVVTEQYLCSLVRWIATQTGLKNLALGGGVALNCVANSKIARDGAFDNIWVFPNPGDAGSSIGAVAAYRREPLNWRHTYLGHNISRPFDLDGAVACLLRGDVIGIATGRAEFGPRALGNRSLLSDPRGPEVKDRVNDIKHRELFRPFASAIMEEHAHAYFELPVPTSPYMQFVAPIRRPESFPAIAHVDGTARVQTVTAAQNPNFYALLDRFYQKTGCPMLLNTSLNIKGEPLVNTWEDAQRFGAIHGISIF
ncbi:MAG: carbamoyltransferase [Candidatus Binataceae bacterium]